MSRTMNFKEFANLVNHVQRFNSPFVTRQQGQPCVKYMNPVFDFRTNSIFSITFRGFGSEHVLHCQNECRDLPDSLYDRCMKYLTGVDKKMHCDECQNDVWQPCTATCPVV